MLERVTKQNLQAVVDRINTMTRSPMQPWQRQGNLLVANVGNYHLDPFYDEFSLVRVRNEDGDVDQIIGLLSKRDLYSHLIAFIAGLQHRPTDCPETAAVIDGNQG